MTKIKTCFEILQKDTKQQCAGRHSILTLSAVIASEVEWTLTVELASEVNACCRWGTRVFFAIYNVLVTVFTYKTKSVSAHTNTMNVPSYHVLSHTNCIL